MLFLWILIVLLKFLNCCWVFDVLVWSWEFFCIIDLVGLINLVIVCWVFVCVCVIKFKNWLVWLFICVVIEVIILVFIVVFFVVLVIIVDKLMLGFLFCWICCWNLLMLVIMLVFIVCCCVLLGRVVIICFVNVFVVFCVFCGDSLFIVESRLFEIFVVLKELIILVCLLLLLMFDSFLDDIDLVLFDVVVFIVMLLVIVVFEVNLVNNFWVLVRLLLRDLVWILLSLFVSRFSMSDLLVDFLLFLDSLFNVFNILFNVFVVLVFDVRFCLGFFVCLVCMSLVINVESLLLFFIFLFELVLILVCVFEDVLFVLLLFLFCWLLVLLLIRSEVSVVSVCCVLDDRDLMVNLLLLLLLSCDNRWVMIDGILFVFIFFGSF